MGNTESKLSYKNKVFRLAGYNNQYFYSYNEKDEIQYNQIKEEKLRRTNSNLGTVTTKDDGTDTGPYDTGIINEEEEDYDSDNESEISVHEEDNLIPLQDEDYWKMFWERPHKVEDIYNLLSYQDWNIIMESNKINFLNLIRVITIKLISFVNNKSKEFNKRHVLNCVRVLTKIVPIAFEHYEELNVDRIFWSLNHSNIGEFHDTLSNDVTVGAFTNTSTLSSEDSTKANINKKTIFFPSLVKVNLDSATDHYQCLGQQLISTLVDLLFLRNFTLDSIDTVDSTAYEVDFKIWEHGIGRNGKYEPPNPTLDSNRLEILRLLLILVGENQFNYEPKEIINNGSKFLTVITATLERYRGGALTLSLLNLVRRSLKSDPEINGLKYQKTPANENINYKNLRSLLVTYSLQLLTVMTVYSIPPKPANNKFLVDLKITDHKPHNLIRAYLGSIQKENEINFLADVFIEFLLQPLEKSIENESNPLNIIKSNFVDSSQLVPNLSNWALEVIVLLWELLQCNKTFKKYIYTFRTQELLCSLFFYLRYYKSNIKWKYSLIRILNHLILYILSNSVLLNRTLKILSHTFYANKIPAFFKSSISSNATTNSQNLTLRDFLILCISQMIIHEDFDEKLTPILFQYLNNLLCFKINEDVIDVKSNHFRTILSSSSSLALLQVFMKFSKEVSEKYDDTDDYELKCDLLTILAQSIADLIGAHHVAARTLLYYLVKSESIFTDLYDFIESEEIKVTKPEPTGTDNYQPGTPNPNDSSKEGTDSNIELDEFDEYDYGFKPAFPTGLTKKSRGKRPLGVPLKYKYTVLYKSLLMIIQVINFVKILIPNLNSATRDEILDILFKIEKIPNYEAQINSMSNGEYKNPDFEHEILKFQWSTLSLGLYESILWKHIFSSNQTNYYNHLNNIDTNNANNSTPNSGNTWFNQRKNSLTSWWKAPSSSPTSANTGYFNLPPASPQQARSPMTSSGFFSNDDLLLHQGSQFEDGILKGNIWPNNTHNIKLFKYKTPKVEQKGSTIGADVNNLFKRFRLNSASSLNTIDSAKSNGTVGTGPGSGGNMQGFGNGGVQLNNNGSNGNSRVVTPRNSISLTISRQNSNNSLLFQ